MSRTYGAWPIPIGDFQHVDLREVMYYLYLPVVMPGLDGIRLPPNIRDLRQMVSTVQAYCAAAGRDITRDHFYVSARKGWATQDNPLNRPGWHADGFGTDDLNFVWWRGAGTRFLIGEMGDVPKDHKTSLDHFEERARWTYAGAETRCKVVDDLPEARLYALDPFVVHATPNISTPGYRQYVKVSVSRHQYNLENNSHNYLFNYSWPLSSREKVRNDTFKAQRDFA